MQKKLKYKLESKFVDDLSIFTNDFSKLIILPATLTAEDLAKENFVLKNQIEQLKQYIDYFVEQVALFIREDNTLAI